MTSLNEENKKWFIERNIPLQEVLPVLWRPGKWEDVFALRNRRDVSHVYLLSDPHISGYQRCDLKISNPEPSSTRDPCDRRRGRFVR